MKNPLVTECISALKERNWTIAFAESASAGMLSYAFSSAPDAGEVLLGGIVCYHKYIKENLLNVPEALIERYTAESAEVTAEMSRQLRRLVQADVCVALTGLTSPGGSETPEKPVGTVFIEIITPAGDISREYQFDGSPEEILNQALSVICRLVGQKA